MSQNLSRRSFLKGVAASALGAAATYALGPVSAHAEGASLAFVPGTYTSVQTTPYATVEVKCTFSETALTDVSYEVLKSSKADYFTPFANPLSGYCSRIVEAGTTEGVDGVTGASLCSNAIRDGVNACKVQALGLTLPAAPAAVLNPQEEGFDTFESDLGEVFSPIQLGSMTIRNRTIKSAGSGPWADRNKDKIPVSTELYGTMARNGVGLILFAGGVLSGVPVFPDSLEVKEGTVEEALAKAEPLITAIHDGGAKVGFQMFFGGGNPVVPDSVINDTPIEELDAFIDRVGIAAERAKSIGIDCIEIKGASADALNGFLTRRVNRREDEYGPQSIENRTRLFRRMI